MVTSRTAGGGCRGDGGPPRIPYPGSESPYAWVLLSVGGYLAIHGEPRSHMCQTKEVFRGSNADSS